MRKRIWNAFTSFVDSISQPHDFNTQHSVLFMIAALLLASVISFLYYQFNPTGTANIGLIYILTVILVSYHTNKYRYGIIAAIISVFCVNYLFTFPFFEFNFTLAGYPFTFVVMYFISILTSATTFHMKAQAKKIQEDEKLIMEAEKEKLRANLLRAVSHDLRTPLTSMIGASSSYLENEDTLDTKQKRELVSHIYEDSNWLLHMVENLLSVTRISSDGHHMLKKTPEPAEEILFDAITTVRKRYPELQVITQIPEEFLIVPMDPLLIKQVILNLLENTYFHARSDHPVECSLIGNDTSITISVKDFGSGIPEDRLNSIFDAMPSAPTSAADTRKGMGIGLSICKAIINAHNGTIYAKNHPDGAEFYFTLPKEDIPFESND